MYEKIGMITYGKKRLFQDESNEMFNMLSSFPGLIPRSSRRTESRRELDAPIKAEHEIFHLFNCRNNKNQNAVLIRLDRIIQFFECLS